MMEKYYCYNCNKDIVPLSKEEVNTYTFRDKCFDVTEVIAVCPNCQCELLGDSLLDSSMNKIYDAYLELFDLSFSMLKEIRTNLNLSQELMAKILGWSKKSIVRYENAESVPQGEYLNMYIRLKEDPFYIMKILEGQRLIFDEKEYYKIIDKLPFYDKYKTVNTILYLLEDNSLYQTSLMKNLFAIDFNNYKEYGAPITDLKYVHMQYGPVIDKRFDLYNFMIKNGYIELDLVEFDNCIKFKSIFNYDEKLFNENELDTLKKVKNKLKNYSATYLSDWSHKFKGWIETTDGEVISYDYACNFDINELL